MCGLLIFSAFAWADERTDRVEIQGIIDALNNYVPDGGQQQVSALFTNDANNQLARLRDLDRRLVPANTPWSEVTRPKIALQSIRFITYDVALVDAANSQYGSMILMRRVPLLMVMKRESSGWRVASLRVIVDLLNLPGALPLPYGSVLRAALVRKKPVQDRLSAIPRILPSVLRE